MTPMKVLASATMACMLSFVPAYASSVGTTAHSAQPQCQSAKATRLALTSKSRLCCKKWKQTCAKKDESGKCTEWKMTCEKYGPPPCRQP